MALSRIWLAFLDGIFESVVNKPLPQCTHKIDNTVETDIDTKTVDRSAMPHERRTLGEKLQRMTEKYKREGRIVRHIDVDGDGNLIPRFETSNPIQRQPTVEVDGVSLEKRCKQLFDPQHSTKIARKV